MSTDYWFGRQAPEGSTIAWGARAIFTRGHIDIVPDRHQMTEAPQEQRTEFAKWLQSTGMPGLKKEVERTGITGTDHTVLAYQDDRYRIEASPQGSCGYLYIGAWQLPPAVEVTDQMRVQLVNRYLVMLEAWGDDPDGSGQVMVFQAAVDGMVQEYHLTDTQREDLNNELDEAIKEGASR
jgi:hypothetical protein